MLIHSAGLFSRCLRAKFFCFCVLGHAVNILYVIQLLENRTPSNNKGNEKFLKKSISVLEGVRFTFHGIADRSR